MQVSTRAQVITRRTYNRPTSDDGKQFESMERTRIPKRVYQLSAVWI